MESTETLPLCSGSQAGRRDGHHNLTMTAVEPGCDTGAGEGTDSAQSGLGEQTAANTGGSSGAVRAAACAKIQQAEEDLHQIPHS